MRCGSLILSLYWMRHCRAGCNRVCATLNDSRINNNDAEGRRAATAGCGGRAAGYRGDDANGVAVFGRRVFFCQITDVFVVDVDVDEAAKLAVFGKQVLAQVAELRGQVTESLADGSGGEFGGVALAGVDSQRRWDHYFYRHLVLLTKVYAKTCQQASLGQFRRGRGSGSFGSISYVWALRAQRCCAPTNRGMCNGRPRPQQMAR